MAILTDAALARRLMERAVAMTTNPTLDAAQVDDLMTLAESLDADANTVYTDADLNRAASIGWLWKAGLTSDQYDLGGGQGRTLTRSQWYDHCTQLANAYGNGTLNVLGGSGTRGSIGVITLAAYPDAEV
jgi:hypothetical protein